MKTKVKQLIFLLKIKKKIKGFQLFSFYVFIFSLHLGICTSSIPDDHRGLKKAANLLELELELRVLLWVLGNPPGTPARTATALNLRARAIPPAVLHSVSLSACLFPKLSRLFLHAVSGLGLCLAISCLATRYISQNVSARHIFFLLGKNIY